MYTCIHVYMYRPMVPQPCARFARRTWSFRLWWLLPLAQDLSSADPDRQLWCGEPAHKQHTAKLQMGHMQSTTWQQSGESQNAGRTNAGGSQTQEEKAPRTQPNTTANNRQARTSIGARQPCHSRDTARPQPDHRQNTPKHKQSASSVQAMQLQETRQADVVEAVWARTRWARMKR